MAGFETSTIPNRTETSFRRPGVSEDVFSRYLNNMQVAKVQTQGNDMREQEERFKAEQEMDIHMNLLDSTGANQANKREIQSKPLPTESVERKELHKQATIADLAYSEFSTKVEFGKPMRFDDLSVRYAGLDPLGFPHLKEMLSGNPPKDNMSSDEIKVYAYMQSPELRLIASNYQKTISQYKIKPDVEEILSIAGVDDINNRYQGLAENLIKADNSGTDAPKISPKPKSPTDEYNEILTSLSLERFRKDKISENGKILTELQKEYGESMEVLDYFPRGKETADSGFRAICLRDTDGTKIFAIAGTEMKSFKDFYKDGKADLAIALGKIPEKQVIDMLGFVIKNLKPGEKFKALGHSLGGSLAETLGTMFSKVIKNEKTGEVIYEYQAELVKTFNSPGVRGLSVPKKIDIDDKNPNKAIIIEKIRDFGYNKENEGIGEKMTAVRGDKGISPIAGLGEHVANHEIRLKGLASHSIVDAIQYIDKEATDIELKSKRIRYKDLEQKRKNIND